jgi:hypothetical protein
VIRIAHARVRKFRSRYRRNSHPPRAMSNISVPYCNGCSKAFDGTWILPLDVECNLPLGVRALLYTLVLIYLFIGVAIASDVFMGAIERITSTTRKVRAKDGSTKEVLVWNATVANLSLMALGSSAPEILLSCIELLVGNFTAGELGPSTIVGSAAFNLLVISAVCIAGMPRGETRLISDLRVFALTTTFSLVAYLWLMLIVSFVSPPPPSSSSSSLFARARAHSPLSSLLSPLSSLLSRSLGLSPPLPSPPHPRPPLPFHCSDLSRRHRHL